ncbi:MAG TPA: carboxylesterase, partial [Marinobacter adhaerens]|nr:carboxylesterase [Marinobacter adhaerens]
IVVRSWADDLAVPTSSGHALVPGMAHWPGGCSASDCWEAIQAFFATQKALSWAL